MGGGPSFTKFDKDFAGTVDDAKLAMLVAHALSGLNRSIIADWNDTESKLKAKHRKRSHLARLSDSSPALAGIGAT